ncbi:hypothetical protein IAD21_00053 [Abditibacteriota bacterium]|nr:hypothetical protein IAD21_00053 [Abditibacteriota bacterium]
MACRVAYLGASVTVQKDGYRPHLHEWLVRTYGQAHQAINAGFGGVGSISGVFTMGEQVAHLHPHLCFIEFSSGDMAGKTPLCEIGPVLEGMVRKLAAIGCQPCFLYLYRRDQTFSDSNPVLREYEKVAEHYGIPSINIGRLIEAMITNGDLRAEDIVKDMVHTTVKGSEVTVAGIAQALNSFFQIPTISLESILVKPIMYARNYENTEIVPVDTTMLKDSTHCKATRFRLTYPLIEIDSTNEVRCQLSGELVGLLVVVGPDSGFIKVESNETIDEYLLWDEWCHYYRIQTVILQNPIKAGEFIGVRPIEKELDFALTRDANDNPNPIKKRLKLVGFLVRKDNSSHITRILS